MRVAVHLVVGVSFLGIVSGTALAYAPSGSAPVVSVAPRPRPGSVRRPLGPPRSPPPRMAPPLDPQQLATAKAHVLTAFGVQHPREGVHRPPPQPTPPDPTVLTVAQPRHANGSMFEYTSPDDVGVDTPTGYATFPAAIDSWHALTITLESLTAGAIYLLDCSVDTSRTASPELFYMSEWTSNDSADLTSVATPSGHALIGFRANESRALFAVQSRAGGGDWAIFGCSLHLAD